MNMILFMGAIWAVITLALGVLFVYRHGLIQQETDWIPLTDDAKEDSAIQAQTIIELKARRLKVPMRALGALSLVLLLVIVGFWLYHGIFTPPPMPQ